MMIRTALRAALPLLVIAALTSSALLPGNIANAQAVDPAVTIEVSPPAVPRVDEGEALRVGLRTSFIVLLGISLIIIVLQGMRYVLSGGDPAKTAQAQRGIIYALVGIVIALAGASVTHFTLDYLSQSGTDIELSGASSLFIKIATILAMVTGVIAVIMIIIAGIRLSLSGGNAEKTTAARNTIIYAAIGLAIVSVSGPLIALVVGLL